MFQRTVLVAVVLTIGVVGARAQQPPAVRVSGVVEGFDGHVLAVKSAKLGEVKINLVPDVTVFDVSAATIADIRPGAYVGVGAMPQADGSQRAIQDGDGNVKMIVGGKFLISVEGSAEPASKLAYAQAIDVAKLSKM